MASSTFWGAGPSAQPEARVWGGGPAELAVTSWSPCDGHAAQGTGSRCPADAHFLGCSLPSLRVWAAAGSTVECAGCTATAPAHARRPPLGTGHPAELLGARQRGGGWEDVRRADAWARAPPGSVSASHPAVGEEARACLGAPYQNTLSRGNTGPTFQNQPLQKATRSLATVLAESSVDTG